MLKGYDLKGYSLRVRLEKDPPTVLASKEAVDESEGHFQRHKSAYVVGGVSLIIIGLLLKKQQPVQVFIVNRPL